MNGSVTIGPVKNMHKALTNFEDATAALTNATRRLQEAREEAQWTIEEARRKVDMAIQEEKDAKGIVHCTQLQLISVQYIKEREDALCSLALEQAPKVPGYGGIQIFNSITEIYGENMTTKIRVNWPCGTVINYVRQEDGRSYVHDGVTFGFLPKDHNF